MVPIDQIKAALSLVAIAMTFIAFVPYIRSIRTGKTRPHVFSWVIWGVTTVIVAGAQLAGGAGMGAWPIAVSGVITLYISYLAFRVGADRFITRSDWVVFGLSLSSLPFWYLTSDPFYAVLILTGIDTLGFIPTFRKAYSRPFEEHLPMFYIVAARNFISILALQEYTPTTILFPATVGATCVLFVIFVLIRRRRTELTIGNLG